MKCPYLDAGFCTGIQEECNKSKVHSGCNGSENCATYQKLMTSTVKVNESTIPADVLEPRLLPSPYHREYVLSEEEKEAGVVVLDYYDILALIGEVSPWRQHAGKKVLFSGVRGHKNYKKDIQEAVRSLEAELKRLPNDD